MKLASALIFVVAWVSPAWADLPAGDLAARAWAVADVILARHVDPPTRQEMLLAGIRAVGAETGDRKVDGRLALRVSNLANPEQLASLLADVAAKFPATYEKSLDEVFLEGMLAVVPGPVELLSSKERRVVESMEANLYVGIQVALGLDEGSKKPLFSQILEGGPADHAGIATGDLIEEVDGVSVVGMPLAKVIDRLRGEEGTDVTVKYSRPSSGAVFTKPLRRSRLPRATIEGLTKLDKRWGVRLDGTSSIGYLKIKEISGSTPRELRTFAEQLETEGAKALVLDLREIHSAGFHPTVLLADALLDGGTIGRVASSEGERVIKAEPDALFRGWPMVVLTSQTSPGEVAWLADALLDNKRATIIGVHLTNTDPIIFEMVPVPDGEWSLKMPTGRLERGNGQKLAAANVPRPKNGTLAINSEQMNRLSNEDILLFQRKVDRVALADNLTLEQALAKARAILEENLKSAGN